jgi:precorrin-2 dehydrogenase / sirohydrochlorin ferrochelatase
VRVNKNPYYPIFLNVKGVKCVVVGGGMVALRKVRDLLEYNADVTVVSPVLCLGMKDLAEQGMIEVLKRKYRSGDLSGAGLAIIAAGDKYMNVKAVREAREKRVLVNVADDPAMSDFIVPSVLRRGDVSIAVSTGGRSPALARKIRSGLEVHFAREYAELALLVGAARVELKKEGTRASRREWQDALDLDALLDLLRKGKGSQAKSLLLSNLKDQKSQK